MASNYQANGVDFDSLLAPLESYMTPAAATNVLINGADAATLYAPVSYGTAPSTLNYSAKGVAFSAIFAAYGSTSNAVNASLTSGEYTTGTSPNKVVNDGYQLNTAGTFAIISGSVPGNGQIETLLTQTPQSTGIPDVIFRINDGTVTLGASGLVSININGTTLDATAATYSISGTLETWTWGDTNLSLLAGDSYTTLVTFAPSA